MSNWTVKLPKHIWSWSIQKFFASGSLVTSKKYILSDFLSYKIDIFPWLVFCFWNISLNLNLINVYTLLIFISMNFVEFNYGGSFWSKDLQKSVLLTFHQLCVILFWFFFQKSPLLDFVFSKAFLFLHIVYFVM